MNEKRWCLPVENRVHTECLEHTYQEEVMVKAKPTPVDSAHVTTPFGGTFPTANDEKGMEWFHVLKSGDHETADSILKRLDGHRLRSYLNDKTENPFTDFNAVKRNIDANISERTCLLDIMPDAIRHPISLAILSKSSRLVELFLHNGVETIRITEGNGNNILHMIVLFASAWPDSSESYCTIYHTIKDFYLNREDGTSCLKTLLYAENDKELRPLELAAKLGCHALVDMIYNTEEVYLVVQLNGLEKKCLYDVTDYHGELANRWHLSPLRIVTDLVTFDQLNDAVFLKTYKKTLLPVADILLRNTASQIFVGLVLRFVMTILVIFNTFFVFKPLMSFRDMPESEITHTNVTIGTANTSTGGADGECRQLSRLDQQTQTLAFVNCGFIFIYSCSTVIAPSEIRLLRKMSKSAYSEMNRSNIVSTRVPRVWQFVGSIITNLVIFSIMVMSCTDTVSVSTKVSVCAMNFMNLMSLGNGPVC